MSGSKVRFIPHFDFARIKEEIVSATKGTLFLLENVRFLHGETTPKPETAGDLASLADYYVNDAFAVDHHPADSVNKIEKFLPSYAGLLLEKEITHLDKVLKNPKQPLLVLIGGAKAHDKLGVIEFLKKKAHAFLMGGAAANTMLYLSGVDVKNSLIDKDSADYPDLKKALAYRNLVLPVDWHMEKDAIYDIGPKTAKAYVEHIKKARTIIWSGPMGFIEKKKFEKGNLAIARAIVKNKKAFAVTGGGETVMFLKKHKLDRKFGFISTGGGAMIDYLAGKKLPGIEALKKKN
jgi:phosphoglycerate kinase